MLRSAKKRGQRLSLSVNTDFAGALKALQEHHEALTGRDGNAHVCEGRCGGGGMGV